jgi:hypothetical protein
MVLSVSSLAQNPMNRIPGMGRMGQQSGKGQDSLKKRDNLEDSITIRYRTLDTSRLLKLDSSVSDFRSRYPVPIDYHTLGNLGTAARSYGFTPIMQSGWDPGFHSYDIYKIKLDQVRFFQTTRPYSELGYLLGGRSEQMIRLFYTRNIRPSWNFSFEYGLINAPGYFKNQSTNNNRYLVSSDYHSKNRRYNLYFVVLANTIQSNENGGIKTDKDYINDVLTYRERSTIPVQLGDYVLAGQSFLNSKLNTGNKQSTSTIFIRQQYDLGKKDSIVTDTTVVRLFYPKFRMEYSFQYNSHRYRYFDSNPDTPFYVKNYNFLTTPSGSFNIEEKWKDMINDFSLYSFPDEKNPQQFLKAGISLQNLTGDFDDGRRRYYNIFVHGEYRNKTRNKKWDIEANGKFFITGLNNADFDLYASLKRYISRAFGYAQIGLQNVNRSPSFIFESASSFSFGNQPNFNKENTTRLFGSITNDEKRWGLSASYYLLSNYTYFHDYYKADQSPGLFNVMVLNGQKTFRVGRRWSWLVSVQFNQRVGNGPLNLPLLFTNQRFAYNGNLGFKNLLFSAGVEGRYHTVYKADNYSPLQSQFFYQDIETIRLKFPDMAAFVHFRIRGFTTYVRAENLNTASFKEGAFGWTNNNFTAPNYAYPGFQLRLGIFWSFVN